jgi:RimJ/RimL family protein N-acetyltransferase
MFGLGALPLDVCLLQLCPPDAGGGCSLSLGVDVAATAAKCAGRVVAQFNPLLPRTFGHAPLPVEKITHFIEAAEPLPELPQPTPDDLAARVAEQVAALVRDGDTLHVEYSALGAALWPLLMERRNLGLHTQIFSDGALAAHRAGVLTGVNHPRRPGQLTATLALGSAELYAALHENPRIALCPTEEVVAPVTIGGIPDFVAVTCASRVDISGLAVAKRGSRFLPYSLSAQVDFLRGAALSPGGRGLVVLPSVTGTGESRILPRLTEVSGGVLNRADVRYVVTEHGVARLWGRTMRERVLEIIRVAHPDHREPLLKYALDNHAIREFQAVVPRPLPELGAVQHEWLRLRDGQEYLLRPLRPSDERALQEFFYSHNAETVHLRYGFTLREMSRQRAQQLVSVRQDRDAALGIFEPGRIPGLERLCGVGRYFLDEGGETAELAFVVAESKRRLGMARTLFERLRQIAVARGLKAFWAVVEPNNGGMLAIFQQAGAKRRMEEGQVRVDLAL